MDGRNGLKLVLQSVSLLPEKLSYSLFCLKHRNIGEMKRSACWFGVKNVSEDFMEGEIRAGGGVLGGVCCCQC